MLVVSELNRDGHIVRRFIASNEPNSDNFFDCYLSLDSDDRVFVADTGNERVILLDSDLNLNRILYSANGEKKESKIRWPKGLCYDEEMKQLIVARFDENEVYVYTLARN